MHFWFKISVQIFKSQKQGTKEGVGGTKEANNQSIMKVTTGDWYDTGILSDPINDTGPMKQAS